MTVLHFQPRGSSALHRVIQGSNFNQQRALSLEPVSCRATESHGQPLSLEFEKGSSALWAIRSCLCL